ncbi:hybrid sensor histidine kinase/response regulator [Flavihumibacter petaseus]|uniref:histidine kinase n=1 Tax=Flavihumibacter petaseus NBRC 106054 TaxID=1220578 RepID=A0A0E9MXN9_9BACT|nr:response regulator [Flavihumibacter petaseus]GAO41875.1 putative two-component hybrid sensor and regulator [Flavihumibacter petaseus NBRC 106054]
MILIVDDKKENIFSLKTLLEIHSFQVDTASSGEEALKKILKNAYFLIILDVQMPGMDGFEVAEAISGFSKARDIPIIFLSAVSTDKKFITKGYQSGGIDYVTKPIDPDLLLLKVKTFYTLYSQKKELDDIQVSLKDEIDYRKKAEDRLQESFEELRSILESIPQIAFTASLDGKLEYVNHLWLDFAVDRFHFPETHPNDIPPQTALEQAITNSETVITECRIRELKSGNYRYHQLTITPVRKDKKMVKWVGVFADIHTQRMTNQLLETMVVERTAELQQANSELAFRNNELEQFAFVTSHDLNEPLRKIKVFGDLLRSRFLSGNEEALTYLNKITKASTRMAELIEDLSQYSRLDISEAFRLVDLNQLLEEILIDLELVIREKGATIEISPLPSIRGISGQIRLLFQNLLSNSLKFSRKEVTPHVRVYAEQVSQVETEGANDPEGRYLRIAVADNGIGFDEQYLGRIFSVFQRLHTKDAYEGSGIGLSIVKKITEKHQGFITAKSREGEGSTFFVILPLHADQPSL